MSRGQAGSPAAQQRPHPWGPCTLTGVSGQPGSDADLQHFVAGLEDGQVAKALVELHLPGAPCTPGTPVLLFQLGGASSWREVPSRQTQVPHGRLFE